MPTKQTESAPNFLQVYTQVRRDRMKHSFLRQISAYVDWRGIRTLLNKKYTKTQNATGNPAYWIWAFQLQITAPSVAFALN